MYDLQYDAIIYIMIYFSFFIISKIVRRIGSKKRFYAANINSQQKYTYV